MTLPQALAIFVAGVLCIAIHASIMTIVVRVAPAVAARTAVRPTLLLIASMIAAVSALRLKGRTRCTLPS